MVNYNVDALRLQDGYAKGSTLPAIEDDACIARFENYKKESQTAQHKRGKSNDFQSPRNVVPAGLDCLPNEMITHINFFVPKDSIPSLYKTNARLHSILEEDIRRDYYLCEACGSHIHFTQFAPWIPTQATLLHHNCGEIISTTTTCRKYPRVRF